MARRFSMSRATPPVIVMQPRRSRGRAIARRVYRVARRGGRRALPTLSIGVGAAVLGYLDANGKLDFLPKLGGESHMTTLALAGYAATRFSRNATVRAVGLAALAAGAFDFGRGIGR